jgi:AcrR family transcriptional regulator
MKSYFQGKRQVGKLKSTKMHIHHINLPLLIENSTIELISEASFETVSLNQIAQRTNVSVPTLSVHFQSKQDLLMQCCLLCFSRMATDVFKPAGETNLINGIRYIYYNYLRFHQYNRKETLFIQKFLKSPYSINGPCLKQEINKILHPFTDYLALHYETPIENKSFLAISYMVNSVKEKDQGKEAEQLRRHDSIHRQFIQTFWPGFQKIMNLPIIG